MKPKIRFVVPTLARNELWLERCLVSIASQGVPLELVVVTPRGSEITSLVKKYDGRIVAETGSTLSAALNQGFSDDPASPLGSSIEYFAWLGDDDVLAPGSLARTLSAMESRPDASFAFGRVRYIDGNGASKWVVRSGPWAVRYARFGANFVAQPGSLIRRKCFERVGGIDESLMNSMDQDLFLKLSDVGSVAYIPCELASFRVHGASISSTKGDRDERTLVSERYRPVYPQLIDQSLRQVVRITDRLLLSVMSRIPAPRAIMLSGKPYHH